MNVTGILAAYNETVEANTYKADVDAALIESGRTIAARIQDAVDTAEGSELTKTLYLMPHLMNILREMGATPAARDAISGAKGERSDGKLGELREVTQGKTAA